MKIEVTGEPKEIIELMESLKQEAEEEKREVPEIILDVLKTKWHNEESQEWLNLNEIDHKGLMYVMSKLIEKHEDADILLKDVQFKSVIMNLADLMVTDLLDEADRDDNLYRQLFGNIK